MSLVIPYRSRMDLRLTLLTPVHIGSGYLLDALSYTIREGRLHHLDLDAWIETHPEPERLLNFLQQEAPVVRQKIQQECQLYRLASSRVISEKFENEFHEELNDPNSKTQLWIDAALKNPLTGRLLIPGSSLKGAIRTALLDDLERKRSTPLKDRKQLEDLASNATKSALAGNATESALNALKIGDFELQGAQSVLTQAQEKKKNSAGKVTPKNACEASTAWVLAPKVAPEHEAEFQAFSFLSLGFDQASNQKIFFEKSKKSFDLEALFETVTLFYRKRFEAEYQKFYQLPHWAEALRHLKPLKEKLEKIDPRKSMLLRVGHYSHVECTSITRNQPEPRKSKEGIPLGPGSTRTLANGLYPFGWVLLEVVEAGATQAHQHRLDQEWQAWQQQERQERTRQINQRQTREAQRQAREAERQTQEAERQAREERRARLSPFETLCEDLNSPGFDYKKEFARLSEFSGEEQRQLAQIFKKLFQHHQEWEGKLNPKQSKKVNTIKQILGEV